MAQRVQSEFSEPIVKIMALYVQFVYLARS